MENYNRPIEERASQGRAASSTTTTTINVETSTQPQQSNLPPTATWASPKQEQTFPNKDTIVDRVTSMFLIRRFVSPDRAKSTIKFVTPKMVSDVLTEKPIDQVQEDLQNRIRAWVPLVDKTKREELRGDVASRVKDVVPEQVAGVNLQNPEQMKADVTNKVKSYREMIMNRIKSNRQMIVDRVNSLKKYVNDSMISYRESVAKRLQPYLPETMQHKSLQDLKKDAIKWSRENLLAGNEGRAAMEASGAGKSGESAASKSTIGGMMEPLMGTGGVEQRTPEPTIREFAKEVRDAAVTGALAKNVLNLSENAVESQFGEIPGQKDANIPTRVLNLSTKLTRSLSQLAMEKIQETTSSVVHSTGVEGMFASKQEKNIAQGLESNIEQKEEEMSTTTSYPSKSTITAKTSVPAGRDVNIMVHEEHNIPPTQKSAQTPEGSLEDFQRGYVEKQRQTMGQ